MNVQYVSPRILKYEINLMYCKWKIFLVRKICAAERNYSGILQSLYKVAQFQQNRLQ